VVQFLGGTIIPSALPNNAEIVTATLSFYAGPYQNGSSSIVVVPSIHDAVLTNADFDSPVIGIVGGIAEPGPNQWVNVPLSSSMLNWIGLDATTGVALMHAYDYYDQEPTEINDMVVSLFEYEGFEPYLTTQYQLADE